MYSLLAQLIIAFVIGMFLAPFGAGILLLIISLIIYEMATYKFTRQYNIYDRLLVVMGALFRWWVGRHISNTDIMETGIEKYVVPKEELE